MMYIALVLVITISNTTTSNQPYKLEPLVTLSGEYQFGVNVCNYSPCPRL